MNREKTLFVAAMPVIISTEYVTNMFKSHPNFVSCKPKGNTAWYVVFDKPIDECETKVEESCRRIRIGSKDAMLLVRALHRGTFFEYKEDSNITEPKIVLKK